MPHEDFLTFQAKTFELFSAGQFDQAIANIRQHAGEFKDWANQTYNWQMCIQACQGKTEDALQTFRDALEAGVWWSEAVLMEDPDLDSIKQLPEFKRLVAICEEKRARVQTEAKPDLIVMPPSVPAAASPLLLALHGRYSNARMNVPYWNNACAQGWMVALPQSSQNLDSHTYCWDNTQTATREIQAHYQAICQEKAIEEKKVVLGGFSQGAGLTLRLSLTGAFPVHGFIAVAPYLPDVDALAKIIAPGQAAGLRGYMILGAKDPGAAAFEKIIDLLRVSGAVVKLEEHTELGHMYPNNFDQSLRQALEFIAN